MMTPAARRIYRLWRSSAILCLVGAAEFAVVAWQRRVWWIAIACVPLLAISLYATRRAARMRGVGARS
ncbi:MAG: hypothetical protein ACHQXA_03700 [Gemmatimonadales bacterium]